MIGGILAIGIDMTTPIKCPGCTAKGKAKNQGYCDPCWSEVGYALTYYKETK